MSEFQRRHSAATGDSSRPDSFTSAGGQNRFSRSQARSATSRRPAAKLPRKARGAQRDEGGGSDYSSNGYVGYSVGRKNRSSSPVRTILPIVIAVALLGALAFGGYTLGHSLGLFGGETATSSGKEVEVFIPEGSTTSEIAKLLKAADVIAKESTFISAVQMRGVENALLPGKYTLKTGMSDSEVIDALLLGPYPAFKGNKLTIPEGLTLEQTAERVETVCGIPAADFIAEAHTADAYVAEFPFLEGVYNNSMEGFLYPKTYDIPVDASASDVIRVLLKQFAIETAGLDMGYAAERNLTLFDVVTIASMVERETAATDERALVSSVIYNRLHEGMRLQICATIVYAIGWDSYDGHPLLETDLEIVSPYNTYQNDGLPAGPICSPRIESIEAAAHPNETDFFYYVLTSEEGFHTFCATWEEFEVANARYHELFNVPN